jgi:2-succinyl-6-hydroxy-2,4-cyclohexadiene-1-carboxylate synthase
VALLVALSDPDAISSLILISATAGIREAAERARRRASDAEAAAGLRTHGLEVFVDDWINRPLTSTADLPSDVRSRDRALRLTNTAEGLARALEGYGQGAQPDVWSELHRLSIPTLFINGDRDRKYADIAHRMASEIPTAVVVGIPDASHNPLIEAPTATYAEISGFLDRHGGPR